jgi:hypothetical protein
MNCRHARPHDPPAFHPLDQALWEAAWPKQFEASTREQSS